ncbi:MAG: ATP-binding protein [Verrucomicrobiales bacterium]|jgi:signal transduction histidine kinase|nr:ATP-binding protein [Verrucomicrobiales bacterium]
MYRTLAPLAALLLLAGAPAAADHELPPVLILANNQPVAPRDGKIKIPVPNDGVYIRVGYSSPKNSALLPPQRYKFKLDGFDTDWEWHMLADMGITVRFYNRDGDVILHRYFPKTGNSPGWNGSIEQSPLTPRRETLTVPADADTVTISVTSAGPSHTLGTYVVAGLTVRAGPKILLPPAPPPAGWMRDGTRPSMAHLVTISGETSFYLADDDPATHAEWRLTRASAPKVTPGETLTVEWRELYSIGSAEAPARRYPNLPPGHYRLLIHSVDVAGRETPLPATPVIVPVPYWKNPWFWLATVVSTLTPTVLAIRYIIRVRVRNQVRRLRQEHAVETERLRIARNLHDDLGARLTHLSMVSDAAENEILTVSDARQGFHKISDTARELVGILYETVWSVDPENDNLESLLNYLSRMIGDLCEPANIHCRIQMDNPADHRQVTSEIRHNISLAVKEAVHNALKYSRATEINASARVETSTLTITIRDNGVGFDPLTVKPGHGLTNMPRRLATIGGACKIESVINSGATVTLVIPIP